MIIIMTHQKALEYTFLKTEADNKITLFIQVNLAWLEKELDITLTQEKLLSIKIENEENLVLVSEPLPPLLYHSLAHEKTNVVLCDNEMNFLAQFTLDALAPTQEDSFFPIFKNSHALRKMK